MSLADECTTAANKIRTLVGWFCLIFGYYLPPSVESTLAGGGSTHYFEMQIPMQIVVSPLGHFGSNCDLCRNLSHHVKTHTEASTNDKWQAVTRRWSTSNTGTHQEKPHTRITTGMDLGGRGTSTCMSVSQSIICFHGPPSLQCHTNRHLHRTRPALKGLSGKKKTTVKRGNGIVGKAGQHVHATPICTNLLPKESPTVPS